MQGYIKGHDYKTSTFLPGQVTDKTTPEEDAKYFGQIRTAEGGVTDTTTFEQDQKATGHFFGPMNNKTSEPKNDIILPFLTVCTIIVLIIILLPHIANKKAD